MAKINFDPDKPLTPRKMFYLRLDHEGRLADFNKRAREIMKELEARGEKIKRTTLPWCRNEAAKEFGYKGPQIERALYEQREKDKEARLGDKLRTEREEIKKDLAKEDYDKVLASLPASASDDEEYAWVKAHPAMSRKNRSKNNIDPVLITVEDILYPPHGVAPSMSAVHKLQFFANKPEKLYDGRLEKSLKDKAEKRTEVAETEEDLQAVEQLLLSVRMASAPVAQSEE